MSDPHSRERGAGRHHGDDHGGLRMGGMTGSTSGCVNHRPQSRPAHPHITRVRVRSQPWVGGSAPTDALTGCTGEAGPGLIGGSVWPGAPTGSTGEAGDGRRR